MRPALHPEADAELIAAAQAYEDQKSGLGEEFLNEALIGFQEIESNPRRFPRVIVRTHREIRRRLMNRFPYMIIFDLKGDRIIIVAIAHAARRPNYWRKRLA